MEDAPNYNNENKNESEAPEVKVDVKMERPEDIKTPAGKNFSSTKLWLKVVAGLYCLAIIMALFISGKALKKKGVLDKNDFSKVVSLTKKDGIGIITIAGPIYQSSSRSIFNKKMSRISTRIKKLSEKKNVKAILIDINSPGGTVGAVQDIYSAIIRAKQKTKKPFVARIGDVAASGGYYVAAACDKIVSHPGSITGSIGVIMSAGNYEELMKKIGFKTETIKSGKFKDIGSGSRQMTKEERAILQSMIDDSYSQFIEAISKGRNMSLDIIKPLADGRVYTGRQAYKLKLVDILGDYQTAVNLAGRMGKVGKDPKIIKAVDSLEDFFSMLNVETGAFSKINTERFFSGARLEYRWEGF
ncbi:MAG: signal peptide peptidase SppA [Elusimicrobiota bacterium]|nr:signal peptide peptidase SppA [Elusimicrobiota bacterium]